MKENADVFAFYALLFCRAFLFSSALRAKEIDFMKKQEKVLRLCIMAMLTALSVVLIATIHFPIFPKPADFLEYDPADIPVLIGAMMLGPIHGIFILFVASAIQAMTVSSVNGIIGFLMHFIASSALVLVPSLIYRKKKTIKSLIIGLVLGTLAMTVVMIPLNFIFIPPLVKMTTGFDVTTEAVAGMLVPFIIPFNLLKAGINSAITFAVFTPISHVLKKYIKVGKK